MSEEGIESRPPSVWRSWFVDRCFWRCCVVPAFVHLQEDALLIIDKSRSVYYCTGCPGWSLSFCETGIAARLRRHVGSIVHQTALKRRTEGAEVQAQFDALGNVMVSEYAGTPGLGVSDPRKNAARLHVMSFMFKKGYGVADAGNLRELLEAGLKPGESLTEASHLGVYVDRLWYSYAAQIKQFFLTFRMFTVIHDSTPRHQEVFCEQLRTISARERLCSTYGCFSAP